MSASQANRVAVTTQALIKDSFSLRRESAVVEPGTPRAQEQQHE